MDNAELNQSQAAEAPGSSPSADPVESAKQMASAAGGAIVQEASSFASAAQDKVQDHVEQQRKSAGQAIGAFAAAIQHAGEELANNDQSMVGHVVKQAADHLGDLAHSVSDKRPDELLQSLRDFSRRSPVAFAACSILAGFAIGRLVRTSGDPLSGSDANLPVPASPQSASSPPSAGEEAAYPTSYEPEGFGRAPAQGGFGGDGGAMDGMPSTIEAEGAR